MFETKNKEKFKKELQDRLSEVQSYLDRHEQDKKEGTKDRLFSLWEKEYKDVLSRSRFALCPRGSSGGLIRFWESLGAGAIPILISDIIALPESFDWSLCTLQIPAKDFIKNPLIVNDFMNTIDNTQEMAMKQNCIKAYKLFSNNNLVSPIRYYYQDINKD